MNVTLGVLVRDVFGGRMAGLRCSWTGMCKRRWGLGGEVSLRSGRLRVRECGDAFKDGNACVWRGLQKELRRLWSC